MSLLFGLAAAVSWGLAEFLTRHATHRLGWVRALMGVQLVGVLAICAVLLSQGALPIAPSSIWIATLGLGVSNAAALLLLYRAFEIGNLSIVAPVAAGFAVVTALLSFLSGERPAAGALGGAGLLVIGVVVIASCPGVAGNTARASTWAGVPHALGSTLCFGTTFWGLGYVTPALGVSWALLVLRGMALAAALTARGWGGLKTRTSRRIAGDAAPLETAQPGAVKTRLANVALVCGVMAADTVGWLAFNHGTRSGSTTIVTALASLSSAITVLLAGVFLRERLSPRQWSGVAAILLGVLLVSWR